MVETILIVDPILIVESIPVEEPNPKRDTIPSIANPIPLEFHEVNVIPIRIPKIIGIITPLPDSFIFIFQIVGIARHAGQQREILEMTDKSPRLDYISHGSRDI